MDTFVKLRPYKGRCLFCLCVISYLIGLSCVTKGGIYVLNIFDSQSGGISLICVVVLEAVAVSWGYGVDKFSDNIKDMIGRKPSKYFVICWKYVTPLDLVAKEKSLVALVPVLGAISCPAHSRWYDDSQEIVMETLLHVHVYMEPT
ncbi:sodium-dependent noradrenaline transporter-like [Pocillopora damicornis]|uniref:sodium-dependent noradrenaline transporter-like n=1 Tax=Pocillopora damicornis TaxID=46731 RepID=UPI000F54DD4B|nr:sodium-dependent noradrenaline transporter-like [Pocillopora damicornis]